MPARIGLVRAPVAPLHAEPRVSSPQTSQAPFGHALLVLAAEADWQRVRTLGDGYEGWAHAGYLRFVDPPGLDALVAADPEAFGPYEARTFDAAAAGDDPALAGSLHAFGGDGPRWSLGCTVRAGGRTLRLPLGAVVHGGQAVLAGETVPVAEGPARFLPDGEALVRTARRYFESTSYQWGGVTPWGADCSGMAQTVYALHGVALPRDAWQQALVGADAGADLAAHRPGDLLFFSDRADGRVTHVGVAAGAGTMCHLALGRGGWAVDDLGDGGDAYAARLRGQLVGARRLFG